MNLHEQSLKLLKKALDQNKEVLNQNKEALKQFEKAQKRTGELIDSVKGQNGALNNMPLNNQGSNSTNYFSAFPNNYGTGNIRYTTAHSYNWQNNFHPHDPSAGYQCMMRIKLEKEEF